MFKRSYNEEAGKENKENFGKFEASRGPSMRSRDSEGFASLEIRKPS